jgi:hypothetical protein
MNVRLLVITLLVLLVIAGLISGLFAGSIQHALTITPAQNRPVGAIVKATQPGKVMPTQPVQNGQMPMITLAQDSFQRANQRFWGTASDGNPWTGEAETSPSFSIADNMGLISNAKVTTLNALLGQPLQENVEVLLTGSVNRFAGEKVNIGIALRWTDTNNWYKVLIDGAHLTILKRANGKTIQIGSMPFKAQGNATYSLRVRMVGVIFFARAWQSDTVEPNNWMLTASDTTGTVLPSGKVGVRVLVQNNTIIKIRSFLATTAGTGM